MSSSKPDAKETGKENLDYEILKGKFTLSLWIPVEQVAMVIGKKGAMITQIQKTTNTKINIPPQAQDSLWASVVVKGDPSGTFGAYRCISDLVEEVDDCVAEFLLPSNKQDLVIGKGGQTIRKLSADSSVRIHVPGRRDPAPITNNIQLEGQVEKVFECLEALLAAVYGKETASRRVDTARSRPKEPEKTWVRAPPPPPGSGPAPAGFEVSVEIPHSKLNSFGALLPGLGLPMVLEDLKRLTGVSFTFVGKKAPTAEELAIAESVRATRRQLRSKIIHQQTQIKKEQHQEYRVAKSSQKHQEQTLQPQQQVDQGGLSSQTETTKEEDQAAQPIENNKPNKLIIEETSANPSDEDEPVVQPSNVVEGSEADSDDEETEARESNNDADDEAGYTGVEARTSDQFAASANQESSVVQKEDLCMDVPNTQDAAEPSASEVCEAKSAEPPDPALPTKKTEPMIINLPEVPALITYSIYSVRGEQAAVEKALESINQIMKSGRSWECLKGLKEQWSGSGKPPELLSLKDKPRKGPKWRERRRGEQGRDAPKSAPSNDQNESPANPAASRARFPRRRRTQGAPRQQEQKLNPATSK